MKRTVLIGLVTLLASIPLSGALEAQTIQFFPAKFVCGFELGNVRLLNDPSPLNPDTDPYEQLKPGNYATLLNVFNYNFQDQPIAVYAATAETGLVFVTSLTVRSFGTQRIGCPRIASALAPSFPVALNGQRIEGYAVIALPNRNFRGKGIYTFESQNAFERHLLWSVDLDGNIRFLWQRLHRTNGQITSPIPNLFPAFPQAQSVGGSGAGGNGLGASIAVEELGLTVTSLVTPDGEEQPNPIPIP